MDVHNVECPTPKRRTQKRSLFSWFTTILRLKGWCVQVETRG